jgi:hypothetical protein
MDHPLLPTDEQSSTSNYSTTKSVVEEHLHFVVECLVGMYMNDSDPEDEEILEGRISLKTMKVMMSKLTNEDIIMIPWNNRKNKTETEHRPEERDVIEFMLSDHSEEATFTREEAINYLVNLSHTFKSKLNARNRLFGEKADAIADFVEKKIFLSDK